MPFERHLEKIKQSDEVFRIAYSLLCRTNPYKAFMASSLSASCRLLIMLIREFMTPPRNILLRVSSLDNVMGQQ